MRSFVSIPLSQLILDDTGSTAEIAAIMRGGTFQSIPTISRLWEPLAYPLLFPNATLGWGIVGSRRDIRHDVPSDPTADCPTTQMWHYRARLLREPRFQIFGRLTNEYIVDMFTRDLETRLNYIRANQVRPHPSLVQIAGHPSKLPIPLLLQHHVAIQHSS